MLGRVPYGRDDLPFVHKTWPSTLEHVPGHNLRGLAGGRGIGERHLAAGVAKPCPGLAAPFDPFHDHDGDRFKGGGHL